MGQGFWVTPDRQGFVEFILPPDIYKNLFLAGDLVRTHDGLAQFLDAVNAASVENKVSVVGVGESNRATSPHTTRKGPSGIMVLVCAIGHQSARGHL